MVKIDFFGSLLLHLYFFYQTFINFMLSKCHLVLFLQPKLFEYHSETVL